jgi:polysaccharide biosynthesis transport protein
MKIMPELTRTTPQVTEARQFSRDLRNSIAVIRKGWRLIVVSLVVCVTLAVIYLAKIKKEYQATTRLLVLQQGGRPLNVANTDVVRQNEGPEDYIPTHALLISSPLVVSRAIEIIGLANLPTLLAAQQTGLDPVREAMDHLKVTRPDRLAKILNVSYRAGSPEEATRMLEAVSRSYEQFLGGTFQKNSNEVITLIVKARDELSRELGDLEQKYLEFRKQTPALIVVEGGSTLIARRLEQWDRAVNEVTLKAVQLKSQLELGRKLSREGTEMWAVAHAMSQLGSDTNSLLATLNTGPVMAGSADYIRQLVQKRQQLSEQYGPQYTKVQELQDQITRVLERAHEARDRADQGEMRDLLKSIDESLKSVEVMRGQLLQEFDNEQGRVKQIEMDLLAESNLRSRLERQRSLFHSVVDQLKQAQFVGDFNSIIAQSIEPANALSEPVWPRTSPVIGLALLTGLMLGAGLAFLADRLDQSIRSPEEIRRVLDLTVLGQIPLVHDKKAIESANFGLICHTKPRSPWAEAYRALRSNLEFLRRKRRVQLVLVTSPHSGDGKSTSASNLAISLAQAGRRVLLIDGDLRKPTQHVIHSLSQERGFSDLLKDTMPIGQVVQPTTVDNLDMITAGLAIPNPAEMLASPRFTELLNEFRRSYDMVIIDSSPLLLVTDPAIIGSIVDGIILVVRPARLRLHEAERVKETLLAVGTPVMGVLVNGIDLAEESYGYGYGDRCYGTYGNYEGSGEATDEGRVPKHASAPVAGPKGNERNGKKPGSGFCTSHLDRHRSPHPAVETTSEEQP